jgi:uncharacterized protein
MTRSLQNHLVRTLPAVLLCALLVWPGCGRKTGRTDSEATIDSSDVYTLKVLRNRKVKDLELLRDEKSPLTATDRESFTGLQYYPPARDLVFESVLERLPKPEQVMLATSKDRPRAMFCIGRLPFEYEGARHALRVYISADTSRGDDWFIPFKDATNGDETYAAGRFIDIPSPRSDTTFLDFNDAYNPYCAYNHRYDCPIPPKENELPIAIRAGEKAYAGHK